MYRSYRYNNSKQKKFSEGSKEQFGLPKKLNKHNYFYIIMELDMDLDELARFDDVPTTIGFDITELINQPITIIHSSLTWDAKGVIVKEFGEYNFVDRLNDKELVCRPLRYSMSLERLGEENEHMYLLSTPKGGGGHICDYSSRDFSKLDEKLKSFNL